MRQAVRLADSALEIIRKANEQPTPKERLTVFKAEAARLNGDNAGAIRTLLTMQEALLTDTHNTSERRDRMGLSIAGGVFLLLLIGVAIFIPEPTTFQERVFAVSLAISGGAAVAFLPGAIAIEASWAQNMVVRAVGAIAFATFILLYYARIL